MFTCWTKYYSILYIQQKSQTDFHILDLFVDCINVLLEVFLQCVVRCQIQTEVIVEPKYLSMNNCDVSRKM